MGAEEAYSVCQRERSAHRRTWRGRLRTRGSDLNWHDVKAHGDATTRGPRQQRQI
ncbi:putative proline-rich receptor-like protein kinase PERK3 [Iris pallida]|uniref:Proline-rich receptor-like protein kinase PERK3 n=1 Tax=Iris pallida TaxID=29817 RepID=A0AAX6FMY5_IRIPA|nr:putative proline-rich receptor-like protein kinase PERK3 [Iris pallida]KAJ6817428.1 putative proline-rich receptor-like protein kinase PERK3 [Iris pallida]